MIGAPTALNAHHQLDEFDCGHLTLDDWLKKRALKNQFDNASRTFVICIDHQVIGYYALATGSVELNQAPGSIKRNMPNPIPVIVLGRLAVDHRYQAQRLGPALLENAMLRTLRIAKEAGTRALLVHAISDRAKRFYRRYGFIESPIDKMTLMLSLKTIQTHFDLT